MVQRQPTQVEKPLRDDDFIVSKTDLKGRITYGNQTFALYAGLTEAEFLGQPHNLIRHPDMPRGVFKLLWDTIANGKEIFAYVKNMSKDGSYYWVFANVTPSYDASGQLVGYYSVRRKASNKGIATITQIYRQMQQIEQSSPSQKDGMERSLAWVGEQLKGMGVTYEQLVLSLQE